MSVENYHPDGSVPPLGSEHPIFVFGSNVAGRHGKGAALEARERYGAVYGVGEGLRGQSYAIPTKTNVDQSRDALRPRLRSLSLDEIKPGVERFVEFARSRPDLQFMVTRIGCALAGHSNQDIAPLFADAPENCSFARDWAPYLDAAREPSRPRAVQGSSA